MYLPAAPAPHETVQLLVLGPVPLGRLLLEDSERVELALLLDELLGAGRAQRADQLVLQVGDTHEEAGPLQVAPALDGAQAGALETSPEAGLLRRVAQPRHPDAEATRAEQVQEVPEVRGAPHRHDEGTPVVAPAPGARRERAEGRPVARALHQDDRAPARGRARCVRRHGGQCGLPPAGVPGLGGRGWRVAVHPSHSSSYARAAAASPVLCADGRTRGPSGWAAFWGGP